MLFAFYDQKAMTPQCYYILSIIYLVINSSIMALAHLNQWLE